MTKRREPNEKGTIGSDNRGPVDELSQVVIGYVNWVKEEIARVEALIDFGALILRYSQPPIEGKVDVRWWITDSSMKIRQPVIVKWMRAKTGKSAGKIAVPKRAVRLKGAFVGLNNGAIADAVVYELQGLIKYWHTLVGMIRSLNSGAGRSSGGIKRSGRDLAYLEDRLVMLRDELVKRLANQGNLVPDEFEQARPQIPKE